MPIDTHIQASRLTYAIISVFVWSIFTCLFLANVSFAQTSVTPRIEQLVKDTENIGSRYIRGFPEGQKIPCTDLTGQIEKITFAINSLNVGGPAFINFQGFIFSPTDTNNVKYSTNIVAGISGPQEYTFTFDPIDIAEDLCVNGGFLIMGVTVPSTYAVNSYYLGSASSDAFKDGNYDVYGMVGYAVRDLFFIINPHSITNLPPSLSAINNQTITEGSELALNITAIDHDAGDTLTYSASSLHQGATFDPNTQTFSWTPDYDDAGVYTVTFTVADNGTPSLSDTETITITVEDTNRSPVLAPISNQTVNEGVTLSFVVSATDADNDTLTFSATNLPSGANFNPNTQTLN